MQLTVLGSGQPTLIMSCPFNLMCTFPGSDGEETEIVTLPPDSTAGVTCIAGWPSVSANGDDTDAPGFGFETAIL